MVTLSPVGEETKKPGWSSTRANQRGKKIKLSSHARRGLRRKCHAWRIRRLAGFGGSSACGNNGLRLARWGCQGFTLADTGQPVLPLVPIAANECARVHVRLR